MAEEKEEERVEVETITKIATNKEELKTRTHVLYLDTMDTHGVNAFRTSPTTLKSEAGTVITTTRMATTTTITTVTTTSMKTTKITGTTESNVKEITKNRTLNKAIIAIAL